MQAVRARRGGGATGCVAFLLVALLAPVVARAAVPGPPTVRWLGVAGFSIAAGEHVILHDPFVSRPGLWRTLFRRYRPDEGVLTRLLAAGGPAPELARAGLVLVGHSHYDHLGDAPWIASRTGATLAGSPTSVNIARGYGLDAARTRVVEPGAAWSYGPFDVRVVESRHARVILGRVPLPGQVLEAPEAPLHAISFKLGDARGYEIEHRPSGWRAYLLSSAALHPPALAVVEPGIDVLLASIEGRDAAFVPTLIEALRPRVVVPHHFDSFFRSLDHPRAGAPRDEADLRAFEREVTEGAAALGLEVSVRRPKLFGTIPLEAAESP